MEKGTEPKSVNIVEYLDLSPPPNYKLKVNKDSHLMTICMLNEKCDRKKIKTSVCDDHLEYMLIDQNVIIIHTKRTEDF